MRPSQTFTVSLPPELAEQVDRLAVAGTDRSELFREAFKRYLASQDRWDRIFAYGAQAAKSPGYAVPQPSTTRLTRRSAESSKQRKNNPRQ